MAETVAAIAAFFTVTITVSASTMAAITTAITVAKTISTIAAIASAAISLTAKPPQMASADIPITSQLAGQTGFYPVAFGRTGYGGQLVLREADDGAGTGRAGWNNKYYYSATILSTGPIAGWESTWIEKRQVYLGGSPVRPGSATGLTFATGAQGLEPGSHTYTDGGLGVAVTLGATDDPRTFSQLIGGGIRAHGHNGASGHMKGLATRAFRGYLNKKMINMSAEPVGFDVLRGQLLYDPRKDSTGSWGGSGSHHFGNVATYEYSDNAGLVALNYALGRMHDGKPFWGLCGKIEDIDIPAFINAANVCDQNNWRLGGVISNKDSRIAVLSNMLASAGSVPVQNGSQLSCYTNAPKPVSMTITGADVISINLKTSASLKERVNRVVGEYKSEAAWWEQVETDAVANPTYLAEDQGQVRTETFSTPLTTNHKSAKQHAAYYLINSRNEGFRLDLTGFPRLLNAKVGRAVMVNIPEMGLTARKMLVTGSNYSVADQKVTLSLQAENDNGHEWALEQVGVAPSSPQLDTFDRTSPPAPGATAWAVTGTSLTNEAGQATPAIVVEGESDNPYADRVVFYVRKVGDVWTPAGEIGGVEAKHVITAVESQGVYEVGVSYRTAGGYESDITGLPPVTVGQAIASTVQPGGIDWSDTGPGAPIVNIPPALGVDQNGQLQPGHIASGVPGFASLEAFNAAQKLFNEQLQQDQADADEKLTDGLAAEAEARDALKTALEDADQTITEDLSGLKNEIVGARGTSTTLAGHLTTIQNDINGKVSATEIEALETEITDARGSFGSVNSRLNKAETDITGKAEASRVSLLESRSRVTPNLIEDGSFNRPLGECWYLEGGAGPYLNYDAQVGSFLHTDSHYVVSKNYPFAPGYQASISWDGEAVNTGANVYLQALPSYALLARSYVVSGEGNGFGKRKVSDGSTVAAPAGTTGFRVVIDPAGGSMNVSRIKVNHGSVASTWSDELTTREATSRIAVVETANANGATRITELEAISDDEYLTLNTGFNLYTNGAQTGFTTPDKWYPWGEKVNDSHRVPGHLGKYAWWSHNNLNTNSGIGGGDVGMSQDYNNNPRLAGLTTGFYVLEADIYFAAGEIGGAGVYWYFQNGTDGRINFATDKTVDGVVVGYQGASSRAYSWRKLVHIDNAGTGNTVFHLMTEWDGFEAGARPKLIEWQRCGLRKATAQEVAAERADTNASNAQSRLTIVESTTNEIVGRGGGGGNLVGNTSLESMTGWTPLNYFGDPSVLDTANLGINYPSDNNWHPSGDNCLSMFVKAPTTVYADWYSDEFPLTPGKTFEFGMSAAVHRTYAECYLEVRNADGSQATYPWALCDGNRLMYENYSGGRDLQAYGQFWGKYTVPTSGQWTRGRLILRRGPTASGQVDSWSWFTRPFCREIPAGQTKPSPWDYGAQRWLSRARWSVQPAVNGATSFITAEAVNNNGVASSNVSIGGQSIQMYNANGQDWKLAMSVQGGNAVFTGNLQASRILLGNGAGWDIQKAQKVFSVTDGQVISFGTDLGAIPSISFERDGLAPLNAGETYDIRAVNLSATGFQLSAKINIPAAQSSQQTAGPGYSEVVNSSGNSGRTLYLEGKPTSVDGAYRFQASGQQEHRVFGRHNGQIVEITDGESLDYVASSLNIWAYNGSWVKVATFYVETYADPYQYPQGQVHTVMQQWSMDETFQLPANVSHVNITREGATNNRAGYVNSVGPVFWQAQGAGSGVRTATPNGAQTRVRIIPT